MNTSRIVLYLLGVVLMATIVGWVSTGWMNYKPAAVTKQITTPVHQPIYADASIYQDAFKAVENHPALVLIRGALVNHHLLAASFIADTLRVARHQNIQRVIIISPNHFNAGRGWVVSTKEDWLTPSGRISTDRTAVDALVALNLVNVDETPWMQEHGIYNILPVIKNYFPRATVIPIILKNGASDEQVDELSMALRSWFDNTTLVIGSFDFSHYKTSAVADQHDEASLKAVVSLDVTALSTLDTDSPPGLRLFLQLMRGDGSTKFTLFHHSNSAKITGRLNSTDTTSYITSVFTR